MDEKKKKILTATIKEKAVAYCMDYEDRLILGEPPLYTDIEAQEIVDSIQTEEDYKAFSKIVNCYHVFSKFASIWGLAFADYRASANDLLAIARKWDFIECTVNTYNELKERLPKDEETQRIIKEAFANIPFDNVTVTEEEGKVKVDFTSCPDPERIPLLVQAKEAKEKVAFNLGIFKGVNKVVETWTKRNGCKAVLPALYKDGIALASFDYARFVGSNGYKFSSTYLKEDVKETGRTPTDYEIERAFFPAYEDIPEDKDVIKIYSKRIKTIEDEIKK